MKEELVQIKVLGGIEKDLAKRIQKVCEIIKVILIFQRRVHVGFGSDLDSKFKTEAELVFYGLIVMFKW